MTGLNDRLKKYIAIEPEDNPGKKTKIWCVYNKTTSDLCGHIKWYGGWRKYIYETIDRERIYDSDLLRYLSEFCENKTKEHYANRGIL